TLEKIRTERDAALAQQTPSHPELPVDLENEFRDSLTKPAPWEASTAERLAQEADAVAADDQHFGDEHFGDEHFGDEHFGDEHFGGGYIRHTLGYDDINDAPHDAVTFHDPAPMHDGYGAL